jgi:hypothetical protein
VRGAARPNKCPTNEAFATAYDDGKEWYPDFEYALKVHERIDKMYETNGL